MKWQTCYYDAALRRMWRTIRRCDHRFISLVSIIIPGYVTVKMAQYSATRAEARAKKLFPHSAAISHLFSPLIQSFIILPLFAACCRLLLEERRTTARGLNHSENLQWKKSVTLFGLHNGSIENRHSKLGFLFKCYCTVIIITIIIIIIYHFHYYTHWLVGFIGRLLTVVIVLSMAVSVFYCMLGRRSFVKPPS